MATQRTATTGKSKVTTGTDDPIEQRVVAFAEQLGTLVGTVQAKTQGWLDPEAMGKELTRIRDGASQLLDQLSPKALKAKKAPAKRKATKPSVATATATTARPSRGLVDAPGKRHRKPPPQARTEKHMTDPKVRVIGNPGLKTGRRSPR
jgi:hypothetical protein